MSKIVNLLNGLTQKKEQKYTLALQAHNSEPSNPQPHDQKKETEPEQQSGNTMYHIEQNTVILDKNVWYLSMVCVVFMGLVALVLSLKAFTQIQHGNTNVLKLSKVVLQQRSELVSLSTSVNELRKVKNVPVMEPNNAPVDHFPVSKQREQQINSLLSNMTVFNEEVKDLKLANQRLMDKLIDLNAEIKKMKSQSRYSQNKGR